MAFAVVITKLVVYPVDYLTLGFVLISLLINLAPVTFVFVSLALPVLDDNCLQESIFADAMRVDLHRSVVNVHYLCLPDQIDQHLLFGIYHLLEVVVFLAD